MLANAFFLISLIALACTLLAALHALLSKGLEGVRQQRRAIYLAFIVYALSFTLYLVIQ